MEVKEQMYFEKTHGSARVTAPANSNTNKALNCLILTSGFQQIWEAIGPNTAAYSPGRLKHSASQLASLIVLDYTSQCDKVYCLKGKRLRSL